MQKDQRESNFADYAVQYADSKSQLNKSTAGDHALEGTDKRGAEVVYAHNLEENHA